MNTTTPQKTSTQLAVGLAVGATLGPLIGLAVGAAATPLSLYVCALAGISVHADTGLRGSALMGSLVGALAGLVYAPIVGAAVRLLSRRRTESFSVDDGAAFGAMLSVVIVLAALGIWWPSWEAWMVMLVHAIVVGWSVGHLAVTAQPPWAAS